MEVNADPVCRSVSTFVWDPLRVLELRGRTQSPRVGRRVETEVEPGKVGGTGQHTLVNEPVESANQAEAVAQATVNWGAEFQNLKYVDPNMVVAKGIVTKRIFTAPEGWKVHRIVTKPTLFVWTQRDEADKTDYTEKEMSWCGFSVMTDTWGDDLGLEDDTQTHMLVDIIGLIKIELIEE